MPLSHPKSWLQAGDRNQAPQPPCPSFFSPASLLVTMEMHCPLLIRVPSISMETASQAAPRSHGGGLLPLMMRLNLFL